MKVLIVDDEPVARQVLRELLEEIPGVTICGEAADGIEALQLMVVERPEAVFMDLEMPGLDGLNTVRALKGAGAPAVVFVTAYQEHALSAFETGAVDYLLKPVRKRRLEEALEKVRRYLPHAQPPEPTLRKLVATTGKDYLMFEPAAVVAFHALEEQVFLLTGKQRYPTAYTLKELEEKLPAPPFRRIHRRTIINTDHIRRISPMTSRRLLLTMTNGMEFVVSKRMAGLLRGGGF